jgi:phosphopantothenoylcysteine synthetase/decarboxylase
MLTNASTGSLGWHIANHLVSAGWDTRLFASHGLRQRTLTEESDVSMIPFDCFTDLEKALPLTIKEGPVDVIFMAAAVADYSPIPESGKRSSKADTWELVLHKNPKLLSLLRDWCGPHTVLVGFKLLSGVPQEALVNAGIHQINESRLDYCFANDASQVSEAHHKGWLVDGQGQAIEISGGKSALAAKLVDEVGKHPRLNTK